MQPSGKQAKPVNMAASYRDGPLVRNAAWARRRPMTGARAAVPRNLCWGVDPVDAGDRTYGLAGACDVGRIMGR